MSTYFFLIDAPHTVPHKFNAWTVARDERCELIQIAMSYSSKSVEAKALEAQAEHLRNEVDQLERSAREAWRMISPAARGGK